MKISQRKLSRIDKIIITIGLICFSSIVSFSQNWKEVGGGTQREIKSMFADSLNLYVGLTSGGSYSNNMRKWDGFSWDTMPTPCFSLGGQANGIISHLGDIYIGTNCGTVLKWNGSTWDTIAVNDGAIMSIYSDNQDLYAMGTFDSIGGIAASRIAKWNGINWISIDTTKWTFGPIYCAIVFNGELYIGGNFFSADGAISRIAKWDGTIWHPLGAGITGWAASVTSFAVYNNELYVAGGFNKTEGSPGNCIAKWDGNQWNDVGGGVAGFASIRCLKEFHGELYAAGSFYFAGGVTANSIAKWDGSDWCSLGNGIFDNVISAMEIWNDTLYIGGGFWTIGGDSINKIAKWTGGNYVDTCGHIVSGINEIINQNAFTIYPNPSSDFITIEMKELNSKDPDLKITVLDVLGREVIAKESSSIKTIIDVSELSQGIYMVHVRYKDRVLSKKIVKE